jgi:alanine racemase
MRPLTATIDTAALARNLGVVRTHAPRSRVLAVVKANAYGHGLERAARAFAAADGLALIEIDAAVRLRESGYAGRLVLLEGLFEPAEVPAAARCRLSIAVHCEEQLRLLDAAPAGARFDVLLKLNTGMNRLGFPLAQADAALARLRAHRAVGEISLMSHFATADEARGVGFQVDAFNAFAGAQPLPRTLANSAAILRHPQTHADWVRPGIMLYGCSPFADAPAAQFGLQPAMTLSSRVIAVQSLAAGDSVGYGSAFIAPAPMRIGVIACGYADGYPRHAPTGTPLQVAGLRTRTIGRVAMDLLCCDLTPLPEAGVGAPVELWGEGVPADQVAAAAGTVSYELLCALAPRVRIVER